MISWIKLDINILDDAKIKIIRSHPNGDSVVLLWIGLLCLAMKSSRPGTIEIADGLPYTLDDLANQFNIEKKTVEMGLALFVKYRMVEVFEGGSIDVINFSKHQKLDGIERTRDLTRARTIKYRERLRICDEAVTRHAPVTLRHVTPTDLDLDKDLDKELKATEPFRLPSKEELENSSKPLILENIEKAADELYEKKIWPKVHSYKNAMLKKGCNERAVLHSLTRCLMRPPENPWAYCASIMKKEDGNFNARDYEKNHG